MLTTRPFILSDVFNLAQRQAELPWQPFRPGVDIYPLAGDGKGSTAALLRYQPGAQVPLHRHSGFEYILVLSGAQGDRCGDYPTGTFVINSPDSYHQVSSASGCIVLVIWEKPVEILE